MLAFGPVAHEGELLPLEQLVLGRLGEVARQYGLAGAVQHGASTLPDSMFHRFPEVETAEIHLATGWQNALYDHPAIMDAAVVGIPHKVLGEEVGAVVQIKPDMDVTDRKSVV